MAKKRGGFFADPSTRNSVQGIFAYDSNQIPNLTPILKRVKSSIEKADPFVDPQHWGKRKQHEGRTGEQDFPAYDPIGYEAREEMDLKAFFDTLNEAILEEVGHLIQRNVKGCGKAHQAEMSNNYTSEGNALSLIDHWADFILTPRFKGKHKALRCEKCKHYTLSTIKKHAQ